MAEVREAPQEFIGEWDDEGVWVYQAYNDAIADWAVEHQRLGGPAFKPGRMTWVKPSFAWVLYRSGYARKHNQNRVLKIKISHDALAGLLEKCECRHGGGGAAGRVQWDPARDLFSSDDGKVPRKMLRARAIQIGFSGQLSIDYVESILAVRDVTDLCHAVQAAHGSRGGGAVDAAMAELSDVLPEERPYMPLCSPETIERLALAPGDTADIIARIGLGKARSC